MSQPTITILLPCYNPPKGWSQQVVKSMNEIKSELQKEFSDIRLVIVNDGSQDGVDQQNQDEISQAHTVEFVNYEVNRGKGHALRQGAKIINTDYCIYTDIDFPYQEESVCKMARKLLEGNEVVLGHRGKDYYDKTPWFRKVVSKTLRWILKTFLRLPTDDSQCGLKGYDQKGLQLFLETKIDRFLFDLEFIKMAAKRKLKIVTSEAELKPNIVFSKVNIKILFRESLNFVRVLFRK